ncbi:MAG TPA: hypothetical protein VJ436_01145 [Anaerolineales bacterium]|nr:hypothetical protein [Anaerolineales bacterium]
MWKISSPVERRISVLPDHCAWDMTDNMNAPGCDNGMAGMGRANL